MAGHSQDQIRDGLVATWNRVVPLSPSEIASKQDELGRLLAAEAGRFSAPFKQPSDEVDRMLALAGTLTQDGLLELGPANLWPDTPGRLFSGILERGVRPALDGLQAMAGAGVMAAALEALLPVPRAYLAVAKTQGQGNLDRDQIEGQVSGQLLFAVQAWGGSAGLGAEAFPVLLGATGALTAAMLEQPGRIPSSADEVLSALEAIHDAVYRCADQCQGGAPGLAAKVSLATNRTLAGIASEGHPPFDRNEIAGMFERAW